MMDDNKREPTSVAFFSSITFAVSLACYVTTVSPSVAGGDSGELLAEGCQLGTPHPPGYPLYMFLTYAVSSLAESYGLSSIAYYMNLSSAFFGASSSALITGSIILLMSTIKDHSIREKEDTPYVVGSAAIAIGLLNTFSPLHWVYSVTSEVFAMNNFFVSFILFLCIQFEIDRRDVYILFGAFVCGLSLTNQHTSVLLEVPAIVWMFVKSDMHRKPQLIRRSAFYFLLGIIPPYVGLCYVAIIKGHPGSWGDVTTISGFVHHLMRKDYGTFTLFSGKAGNNTEGFGIRTYKWLLDFSYQVGSFASILLLFGCFICCINRTLIIGKSSTKRCTPKQSKGLTCKISASAFLVICLVFYIVVFHSLSNLPLTNPLMFGVHQRFWMQPNIIAFIISGVGLSAMGLKLYDRRPYFILLSCYVMWSARRGLSLSDQRSNYFFYNYARGILDPLPHGSLLFINYDQQWTSIRYMQECESIRPDITSINLSMMSYEWFATKRKLYEHVSFPGTHYTMSNTVQWKNGGFTFRELVESNYEAFEGNIFIGGNLNYDNDHLQLYDELPLGMSRKLNKREEQISLKNYQMLSSKYWSVVGRYHSELPKISKYSEETWEWTIHREFFQHLLTRSSYLLDIAIDQSNGKASKATVLSSLVESAMWMEYALRADMENSSSAALLKNLGLAYLHIVRSDSKLFSQKKVRRSLTKMRIGSIDLFPYISEVWLSDTVDNPEEIKTWATKRWSECWGEYLLTDDAKEEGSYVQVKQIYDEVHKKLYK